jgi:tetrapyrrole methylase family protein/MazG family protein
MPRSSQTLRLCKKVFYLHTEPKWIHDYLRDLSPEVVDIHRYYNEDTPREEAYIGMVQAVLEAAIQSPPVALALYGHPVVFVTPTQSILEVAPKHGLKVKVLPGISAFDCMLADLGVDPSQGTLIYEVNDMLLFRRRLLPDLHCFIWQVGGVESEVYSSLMSRPSRFTRLKQYLLHYYPPEHEGVIITCATNPAVGPKITKVKLGNLEAEPIQMHAGATLYIPPARASDSVDEKFQNLLRSRDHLREITVGPGEAELGTDAQ